MHVYLVRHGETFLSRQGIHQSPNTPLSPRGKEQAESLAEYLRSVDPDLIITSPYTRAVETARVIGLHAGKKATVHPLFYEIIRPSSLYHTPLLSLKTVRYFFWFFFKRKNPSWRYEDAESYAALAQRAEDARLHLESLHKKRKKSVVVVSHAVFIRMLLTQLCEQRVPTLIEFVKLLIGSALLPHGGVVHLVYGAPKKGAKTCAWSVVHDTPWLASATARSPLVHPGIIRRVRRVLGVVVGGAALIFLGVVGTWGLVQASNTFFFERPDVAVSVPVVTSEVFPVSVDAFEETIVEAPGVQDFFREHVAPDTETQAQFSWMSKVRKTLASLAWYQHLASASHRTLVILPGERQEEVVQHTAKILGWDTAAQETFVSLVTAATPGLSEGVFMPGTYTVSRNASPEDVAALITHAFQEAVLDRYGAPVAEKVPLQDALTIASLIEREAYDFTDMRQISGVIWNRLFADMRLQIDATLQYAKGSTSKTSWWPVPRPQDKYIDSPYNTYRHTGLPPAPIANPSLEAILAALNPVNTECMYYFHDRDAGFHCTETYEDHVALLIQHYGRGK